MYYKTENKTTNYPIFSSENLEVSRVLLERERERERERENIIKINEFIVRRYNSSQDYYTLLYYSIRETLIPDREKYPG
jgi:hypothetical protein